MTQDLTFTYRPIGILRSPYARRIDAPHQSTVVEGTESGALAPATLELEDWLEEKVLQGVPGDSLFNSCQRYPAQYKISSIPLDSL